jgi:CBS domain-containing protein
MSPRAGSRLESLGFADVYDYVGGKVDWFGAGLPREGPPPGITRLVDVVERDVPTCTLDERVGDARARMGEWRLCVVIDDQRVVLGFVSAERLPTEDDRWVGDVMQEGPSTARPHLSARQAAARLDDERASWMLVSEADGRLVGLAGSEAIRAGAR